MRINNLNKNDTPIDNIYTSIDNSITITTNSFINFASEINML